MGLSDLVQQDASRNLSVLLQRARFLARYTDSRGFVQQLNIILRLVYGLSAWAAPCSGIRNLKGSTLRVAHASDERLFQILLI